MSAMAARYKTAIGTPHGPRTCFEAVRQREGNLKSLVAQCKYTTSPIWHHPALASPRGRNSWRRCDANPSSSADHAMTTSTPGSHQPPSQPRHRSPESRMPGNRARPVRRGTAPKRTRQRGHLATRLPNHWDLFKKPGQSHHCMPVPRRCAAQLRSRAAGPGSGTGRHRLAGGCQIAVHG
jgi:hypothetical protein